MTVTPTPDVVILVDVDGVVAPLGPAPTHRPDIVCARAWGFNIWMTKPVIAALHRWHTLPHVTMRWCTSWGDAANTELAAAFHLPTLPVVPPEARAPHATFKTAAVHELLRTSTPFVWLDDDLATQDTATKLRAPSQHSLFCAPDPHTGLTEDDLTRVDAFLTQLAMV